MQLDDKGLEFELTDDERVWLRDISRMPGFRVLERIQRSYAESLAEGAQSVSMADPLNNQARVVSAWMYAKVAANLCNALHNGVELELELLRMRQAETLSPEEVAMRRRKQFALEAIPQ